MELNTNDNSFFHSLSLDQKDVVVQMALQMVNKRMEQALKTAFESYHPCRSFENLNQEKFSGIDGYILDNGDC